MLWQLVMRKHDDRNSFYNLYYDTVGNTLHRENGDMVTYEGAELLNKPSNADGISVRIAMGKKCNFNCAYCSQHSFREREIEKPWKYSPEELAEQLIKFTAPYGGIADVQYWGGETLLYFDQIKRFQKYFNEHTTNNIRYSIITNGSLLKGKIFDWILENDIYITISYDGDGQKLRGVDIFEDEEIIKNVKRLIEHYKGGDKQLQISPVMSVYNTSHVNFVDKVISILGTDDFMISEAVPIMVADERMKEFAFDESFMPAYSSDLYQNLIQGKLNQYTHAQMCVRNFIKLLGKPVPVDMSKCFVSDRKVITIDTSGNLQVCQNISSDGTHDSGASYKYGNIFEDTTMMPEPNLDALIYRRSTKCKDCLVVAVCKGGCPYTMKAYEDYNCMVNFYQYAAFFAFAVSYLTGDSVANFAPVIQEITE